MEAFAASLDPLFGPLAQRPSCREDLHGLRRPRERNTPRPARIGTEPVVGAPAAPVQRWQGVLSESAWDIGAVQAQR